MEKATSQSKEATLDTKPVVVQSAKDAINAMYAKKSSSGLSDYLADSSKELDSLHSNQKSGTDAKSAASIHRHSSARKMESVRTSASALLKVAGSKNSKKSAQPLVTRTSLELNPKKPGVHTIKAKSSSQLAPNSQFSSANRSALRPKKSPISLNSTIHTHNPQVFQDVVTSSNLTAQQKRSISKPQPSIVSQTSIKVNTTSASKPNSSHSTSVKPAVHIPKPSSSAVSAPYVPRPNQGEVVDFVARKPRPAKSTKPADTPDTKKKPKSSPLDSIKKRFAPAPKGYAANSDQQARPDRPYQAESFIRPKSSEASKSSKSTQFYGLDDDSHSLGVMQGQPNRDEIAMDAGLGVIEDYHSDGTVSANGEATVLRRDGPDNNKYALSAQSPYYLKGAASVEKRPLSGNGVRRHPVEAATSVYAGQDLDANKSNKNQYTAESDKKSKKKTNKKSETAKSAKVTKVAKSSKPNKPTKVTRAGIDAHPTMIIPSRSRSSAPMVALLLLTVLLGAIVGALAYLFFFQ